MSPLNAASTAAICAPAATVVKSLLPRMPWIRASFCATRSLILGTTDCTKRRSAAIPDLGRNTGGAGGLPSACDSPVMIFLLIAIIASSNLRHSHFILGHSFKPSRPLRPNVRRIGSRLVAILTPKTSDGYRLTSEAAHSTQGGLCQGHNKVNFLTLFLFPDAPSPRRFDS